MSKSKQTLIIVLAAVVGIAATAAFYAFLWGFLREGMGIIVSGQNRFSVEKSGGIRARLSVSASNGKELTGNDLKGIKGVIEGRLDAEGILTRNIILDSKNREITLELPAGVNNDYQKMINELIKNPTMTFQEVDENIKDSSGSYQPTGKIVLDNSDVADAKPAEDKRTGAFNVELKLNPEGTKRFAEATKRMTGKPMGIFMDGRLIIAPVVQVEITNGEVLITGQRNLQEARNLADTIMAGKVPYKLTVVKVEAVTPR